VTRRERHVRTSERPTPSPAHLQCTPRDSVRLSPPRPALPLTSSGPDALWRRAAGPETWPHGMTDDREKLSCYVGDDDAPWPRSDLQVDNNIRCHAAVERIRFKWANILGIAKRLRDTSFRRWSIKLNPFSPHRQH